MAAFQYEVSELLRRSGIASAELSRQRERLRYMMAALDETPDADAALYRELEAVEAALDDVAVRLQGDRVRSSLNQATVPSVTGRLGNVSSGHWGTRLEPTEAQRRNVEIAEAGLAQVEAELSGLVSGRLQRLEQELAAAGAPWTPGRRIGG